MQNIKVKVPSKDRVEWKLLVTSKLKHRFQNYVLQLKIAEFRVRLKNGKIDVQQAIEELHQLCTKYAIAMQYDFELIFKRW